MKIKQVTGDTVAVILSVLCVLHCLFMPLLVIALPSWSAYFFANEEFHFWLMLLVIPVSSWALYAGFKNHSRKAVLALGGAGIFILTLTAALGHDFLSHELEELFTIAGTFIVTIAHIWNYYLWATEDQKKSDSQVHI